MMFCWHRGGGLAIVCRSDIVASTPRPVHSSERACAERLRGLYELAQPCLAPQSPGACGGMTVLGEYLQDRKGLGHLSLRPPVL